MNLTDSPSQLSYLKFFLRILRIKFIIIIILNITIGFLDGIGLTMLIPLLQSMDNGGNSTNSLGHLKHVVLFLQNLGIPLTITAILLVFLAIFILKNALKYGATLFQAKTQLFFIKKLQLQFLRDLRQISYNGYLQLDAGNIQNTIIAEVWRVSEAMKSYLKWIQSVLMLLMYVVLAYLANPQFAFLISVTVGLSGLAYRNLFKKIKMASYQISQKGGNLNGYLIELVHYFKYLKSTNYIRPYSQKLKDVINETFAIDYKLSNYSAILTSIREPTAVFMVVIVMIIQVKWMGGSVGSIILSLLLFYRGLQNLMNLQNDWQGFLRFSGAFRMVSEATDRMKVHQESVGSLNFTTIKKEIFIENVYFSFGSKKILSNVNLRIPKKTTIALTGASGSGKTTLVNIISGLLKPDKGTVRVDDVSLNEYNINKFRNKIGYISQESVIFNDTIFNNITFWAEHTEENLRKFWETIELASLTDFLSGQEEKEHTRLGDNGVLISGGQRQRISIARELFKNPEILIMDEATSALDSETEKMIQENIEKLQGSYTIIIIAHRLSTIRNVDEIYFLEEGQIVNSGKFEHMVENSLKFRNLVTLQGL